MDKILPALHRDFPEFEAQKAFTAAIPVYAVRLTMEVIEPHKLTAFQAYFLQALSFGVNTQYELAHLFGVRESDLISPGASLLKLGYIEQKLISSLNDRQLVLTDKGKQALHDSGPPLYPDGDGGKSTSMLSPGSQYLWKTIPGSRTR